MAEFDRTNNVREILETAGITDRSQLEKYMLDSGFDRRTIRSSMRGFDKYQKNSDNNDFVLSGDGTFRIFDQNDRDITGEGRLRGNSTKKNIADAIGLGTDVSRFVGIVGNINSRTQSEEAATPDIPAAETPSKDSEETPAKDPAVEAAQEAAADNDRSPNNQSRSAGTNNDTTPAISERDRLTSIVPGANNSLEVPAAPIIPTIPTAQFNEEGLIDLNAEAKIPVEELVSGDMATITARALKAFIIGGESPISVLKELPRDPTPEQKIKPSEFWTAIKKELGYSPENTPETSESSSTSPRVNTRNRHNKIDLFGKRSITSGIPRGATVLEEGQSLRNTLQEVQQSTDSLRQSQNDVLLPRN